MLRIEWDLSKNASNKRKHGFSFEEARVVFYDADAILLGDPDDLTGETGQYCWGLMARFGV